MRYNGGMRRQKFPGLIVLMAMLILPLCGQVDDGLKPGQIVVEVKCRADINEAYSLYLPSTYTVEKKWPVLFAFDPGAQTSIPLELFLPAAEAYGYIVVCPKNAQNGPWEPVIKAMKAVWQDVKARLSIDERRLYASGFSGGARAASLFSLAIGTPLAGIIACGAGLAPNIKPEQVKPAYYYGIVGLQDFNYKEFVRLAQGLSQAEVEYAVEVTPGPHQWASVESCTRASEWLELDAMKKGLRPTEQGLIDAVYDKLIQRGDELEKEGWSYYAAALYRYALPLLSGLKDTADLGGRLTRIQASKEYEEFLTAETRRNRQEIDLIGRFAFTFSLVRNTAPGQIRFSQVAKDLQIADLVKMEAGKDNIFDQALARRLLLELLLKGRQEGEAHLRKGDPERAALFFEITIAAGTENVNNFYNLACAYALSQDKKKALKSLQRAIDLGFTDIALLESDKMLASLRRDKAFIALVQAMREKN